MTTTYVRQTVPSPATDDTLLAAHINSEIDAILVALNDFDASNCKKSGTSIPLANINNLTSTQMAAAYFKNEPDMASNSATSVSSQQAIKAYVDAAPAAAMTPSSYAGDESVTHANGKIEKTGAVSKTNGQTITFAVAFPTAIKTVVVTIDDASGLHHSGVDDLATTGFTIRHSSGTAKIINWIAIGY